jgi:hypothetical protein
MRRGTMTARAKQLAAMDVTALVAELCALRNASSGYDEQAHCCVCVRSARPSPRIGAVAKDAVCAIVAALTRGVQHARLQRAGDAGACSVGRQHHIT